MVIIIKEKLEELGELGKDYFFCSPKLFKTMQEEIPKCIKIIDGKEYLFFYNRYIRCVIIDEFTPSEEVREKPKKKEHKNFAKDYLMKGKRW